MATGDQNKQLSLGQKVHLYAKGNLGQQVGRGECYDLADYALRDAGAKSAPSYGEIKKNVDYKWGKEIKLQDVRAGDILQFRNHKIQVKELKTIRKTYPNGGWEEKEETTESEYNRGHHTAIVAKNNGRGELTIFEQHVRPPGQKIVSKKVQENSIYVSVGKNVPKKTVQMQGGVKIETTTLTTVKVFGKIWAYRAVPK